MTYRYFRYIETSLIQSQLLKIDHMHAAGIDDLTTALIYAQNADVRDTMTSVIMTFC